MTIKEMAMEYGWKHGDEYRQDYASLAFSFEQGAKAVLKEIEDAINGYDEDDPIFSHYINIVDKINELKQQ